ncbi:MAG: hypothetical protein HYS20_06335 [Rhodocyclales bacterium]|nr:hypothetical protein [Rhodocyclales bacterium]
MRWVGAGALACAAVLVPAADARATQLGSVSSVSLLGQPLRIEISAPGATAEYAARCAQLVTPTAAPDGIPAVLDARLTVAGSGPDAQLVVSHGAPVRDPVLRVAVRDVCDSRHQREYTLLLPVATSIAPPATTAAKSASVASAAARPPAARTTPDTVAAEVWTTVPGESIATLAQALHPRNARARRALMARLFDLNPELASNGLTATTPLPPGTQLRVPDPAALVALAPEPTVTARPPRKSAPATDNSSRLILEGETAERPDPADAATSAGARKGSTQDETSEEAREQRLVRAIDDSIRAELELFERIRRLEEIEQALRAQLVVPAPRPAVPPVAPLPPIAAKPASDVPERTDSSVRTPPPPPARTTWGQWMFLLAALVGVLGVILFYETRRVLRTRPSRPDASTPPQRTAQAFDDDAATTQLPTLRPAIPATAGPRVKPVTAPAPEPETTARMRPPPPRVDLAFDAESTAPLIVNEELVEEHDSAVELADIMISFGRVQGAAETLSDFIRANPRQSVAPWIKLMEVYRLADMRIEFDALARQLNKTFNVKTVTWDNFDEARKMPGGLEQLPHAIDQLVALWGTTECQAYLDKMLRDNRDGTRQGLSLGIIDDILMLWSVLEDQLGRFHGDHLGHAA